MTDPNDTLPLTATDLRLLTIESRAKALFAYHPMPLFELDPEGRFRHANLAAARFADLNEQEGKGVHFSRFIAPAHRERVERNFQRALGGRPSRCEAEVITLASQHRQGQLVRLPIACERGMLGAYVWLPPHPERVPPTPRVPKSLGAVPEGRAR